MEYIADNLFNLENPDRFTCHVTFFRKRPHKHLDIAAYHDMPTGEERYFDFSFLEYFEGSLIWQGANFRVAHKDELKKLLQKLKLDVDVFLDSRNLYVVETLDGYEVKIVASNALEIKKSMEQPAVEE